LNKIGTQEKKLDFNRELDSSTVLQIEEAFEAVKEISGNRESVAELGEQALQGKGGPAAPLIAWQAATLCYLFGRFPDIASAYGTAQQFIKSGRCHDQLMNYLKDCNE
jgi:anthranilate phosphoribosyltransferase